MVVTKDAPAWMFQSVVVLLDLARGILVRGGVSAVPRGVETWTSRPSGKIEHIHEQAWKVFLIAFTGVHGFKGAEWVRLNLKGGYAFPSSQSVFSEARLHLSRSLFSAHGMNIHDSHVVISMIPSIHGSFGFNRVTREVCSSMGRT
jgi:hypothetical protein